MNCKTCVRREEGNPNGCEYYKEKFYDEDTKEEIDLCEYYMYAEEDYAKEFADAMDCYAQEVYEEVIEPHDRSKGR